MRRILAILAAAVAAAFGLTVPTEAAPPGISCTVSAPISAEQLNAPNDAFWHFEVFNAVPNISYRVKVNWPGDPSNGSHTNSSILTDSTGYGLTALQRYWSPDGFLPGGWPNGFDPFNAFGTFVAVPGEFSVQVGPKTADGSTVGKANCGGTVLP